MFCVRLISLPVLVAFALLCQDNRVSAYDVRLFDYTQGELDIGNVSSDLTTVGELKRIVAVKKGIEFDNVRLVTVNNHALMDDEELLMNFVSIYETGLYLKICDDLSAPGVINIHFAHDRIRLVVNRDKTLESLKREALGEVDTSLYQVVFQGRELTESTKTLGELHIYEGAHLDMFKKNDTFRVTVILAEGIGSSFEATLDTRVADLMEILRDKGLDTDKHFLLHNGKVLENNSNLFSASVHSVFDGFTFHLGEPLDEFGGKLMLFQKKPEGVEHYNVIVKSSTSVRELKQFAFKAGSSIPVEEMQLKLINLIIDGDSHTLGEYNIYKNAWLQVSKQPK